MYSKTYSSSTYLLVAIALLLLGGSGSAQNTGGPSYKADAVYLLNTSRLLAGIGGAVTVETPKVVRPKDYSYGGIALVSTDPNIPINISVSITVGYIVFPARYGNSIPRLFVQYVNVAPDGKITGCLDTDCPGFVKTDKKGLIGSALVKSSRLLKRPTRLELNIQQDTKTKNFVIYVEGMELGYYPHHLFTGKGKRGINTAGIGGILIDSTGDSTPASQIGSGLPGILGNERAAHIADIKLVEASGRIITLNHQGLRSVGLIELLSNPKCYSAKFVSRVRPLTNSAIFYYGGPGCHI